MDRGVDLDRLVQPVQPGPAFQQLDCDLDRPGVAAFNLRHEGEEQFVQPLILDLAHLLHAGEDDCPVGFSGPVSNRLVVEAHHLADGTQRVPGETQFVYLPSLVHTPVPASIRLE